MPWGGGPNHTVKMDIAKLKSELKKVQKDVRKERKKRKKQLEDLRVSMFTSSSNDALIWAPAYIEIVAGEFVNFFRGTQPPRVPPRASTISPTTPYPFILVLAAKLGQSESDIRLMCNRILGSRNNSAHCPNKSQLLVRTKKCRSLFTKYPQLSIHLPDQYNLLVNGRIAEKHI